MYASENGQATSQELLHHLRVLEQTVRFHRPLPAGCTDICFLYGLCSKHISEPYKFFKDLRSLSPMGFPSPAHLVSPPSPAGKLTNASTTSPRTGNIDPMEQAKTFPGGAVRPTSARGYSCHSRATWPFLSDFSWESSVLNRANPSFLVAEARTVNYSSGCAATHSSLLTVMGTETSGRWTRWKAGGGNTLHHHN